MSQSLMYRPRPIEPPPMAGAGHPFKGVVLNAMGLTQTEVAANPWGYSITVNSPIYWFLKGVVAALPTIVDEKAFPNDKEYYEELIRAIDEHGEVEFAMIG